jgi:hypothetical protein
MRSVVGGVLFTLAAAATSGQVPTPPPPVVDIVAAMESESDADAVMRLVLSNAMANSSKREFFLASQIWSNWLPDLPGLELVRLNDAEASAHLKACGTYWQVSQLERRGDVVSLSLGKRCGGTVLGYVVSFDRGTWRLGPPGRGNGGWAPGIGSGFVGRPQGCPCVK